MGELLASIPACVEMASALQDADLGASEVSVLLGRGDGTFEPRQGFSAGGVLEWLVAEDFDGDGLLDLQVHVETSAFELESGATGAVLTGTTFGGVPVVGTDTVRIVAE